ncbi:hypothetical protein HPB48_022831 [Haemaphysalis longicornis]|uniref:Uncharacterized protein n=1 Tax=Haemaphysalis longicornis TaxID=44386 RepID=A0A9J6GC26_HAELO|nr:hypothetical protein HPB48_022831 [Haemaphysalis longicornis]
MKNGRDVSNSLAIFSQSTASALRFMVEHESWDRAVLTTAWFIDQVNHWFDLMCTRSPTTALSLFDQEKYRSAIHFLRKFKEMFETVQMGGGEFKRVQTGIVLSTASILDL